MYFSNVTQARLNVLYTLYFQEIEEIRAEIEERKKREAEKEKEKEKSAKEMKAYQRL